MTSISLRPHRMRASTIATATATALSPGLLLAQVSTTPPKPSSVIVTGNPLRSTAIAAPTSVLSGDALVLRRGSTLGETLDGLPGLSSSYFGPNANRPMIRGQDGDRIRILSNSGVPLDASALSYDHAVPIDPLVVERIEVLRGPAALLYGGGAIGGVVNAIDNRIPKAAIDGVGGAAELRYGGPATERGAGALVETGGNGFALHADGFWRKTDDMKVPWYQRPTGGRGAACQSDTIINSASDSYGGAVGGSMVWDQGYFGASVDTFRSDYGTVAEEDVTIDMVLEQADLRRRGARPGRLHQRRQRPVAGVRLPAPGDRGRRRWPRPSRTRAPTCACRPSTRTELGGGKLAGVFGLQTENADFSALGDEAFVPSTTTRQFAVFALEEWSLGRRQAQLRRPHRPCEGRIPTGDAPGPDAVRPSAIALVHALQRSRWRHLQPVAAWQLSGNLAYTERAPSFYELYANGLHIATGAYEVGNPNMAMEKGSNLDVAAQWKDGPNVFKAGAFYSDFSNYIALLATGQMVDTDEGPVPEYAFTGVPAKLYGWRSKAPGVCSTRATGRPGRQARPMRATNEAIDQPLPRIPPAAADGRALNWRLGDWAARAEVIYAAEQDRVPTDDVPTPAYTLVNLAANYRLRMAGGDGCVPAPEQRDQRVGLQRHDHRHGAAVGAVAGPRLDGRAATELLKGGRRPSARRASSGGCSRCRRGGAELPIQAGHQGAELGVVAKQLAPRGNEAVHLLGAQRKTGRDLVQELAHRRRRRTSWKLRRMKYGCTGRSGVDSSFDQRARLCCMYCSVSVL